MTTPNPSAGQQAATRSFPSEARLIEKVMILSESFRELCDDLAEAERALAATNQMPEALRRGRRAECQEWVESLTNEIERVLLTSKVVPIAGAKRKPPLRGWRNIK
jgi:hypothetical protein